MTQSLEHQFAIYRNHLDEVKRSHPGLVEFCDQEWRAVHSTPPDADEWLTLKRLRESSDRVHDRALAGS
ncbi:MAG TPA: hypothetical protein VIS74_06860 [Chthoniobacterales bacterium]